MHFCWKYVHSSNTSTIISLRISFYWYQWIDKLFICLCFFSVSIFESQPLEDYEVGHKEAEAWSLTTPVRRNVLLSWVCSPKKKIT
jgi:hypothetical protein